MKVEIKLGNVKKFGIGWCICHRVVADKAKGGFMRPPPQHLIGLKLVLRSWKKVNKLDS